MLWIGLYFPELSLQIAERGLAAPEHAPAFVIKEGPEQRAVVCAANAAARRGGISDGMQIAAAQVLIRDLLVIARNTATETAALQTLADWAGQFTPALLIEAGAGLLLEVAASIRLFKGLTHLLHDVQRGLADLGYTAQLGLAPTSRAAWLFAQANTTQKLFNGCRHSAELPSCVDALNLKHGTWPPDMLAVLPSLGIHTFKELRALPRAQLLRRFGPQPLRYLDRVYAVIADPRPWYAPPERYRARYEFLQEVLEVEALLFPMQRLFLELEGFLKARDAGVQQLTLVFTYSGGDKVMYRLALGLLAPERDTKRLLSLTRERLEQAPPRAPVAAIGLEADALLPFVPFSHSLLSDTRQQAMDWRQLRERLQARLGAEQLFVLQNGNDHRPELATIAVAMDSTAQTAASASAADRPLWLLPQARRLRVHAARPHYRGELTFQVGPERIESGWWDGRRVQRDYYIARNPAGETVWIYRDHQAPRHWFLQGLFA